MEYSPFSQIRVIRIEPSNDEQSHCLLITEKVEKIFPPLNMSLLFLLSIFSFYFHADPRRLMRP